MQHPAAQPGRAQLLTLPAVVTAIFVVLAAVLLVPAVRAQEPVATGLEAEIRSGDCAAPGDVTALLGSVPLPPPSEGPTVAGAVTDVAQPLSSLTADPHILLVEDPADGGTICGPIDGQPIGDDGLATALASADGQIVGIAWLRELGVEATSVHLFLVAGSITPADTSGADASPSPSTSPDPDASPSPTAEPGVVPGGEIDPGDDIDVDVDG